MIRANVWVGVRFDFSLIRQLAVAIHCHAKPNREVSEFNGQHRRRFCRRFNGLKDSCRENVATACQRPRQSLIRGHEQAYPTTICRPQGSCRTRSRSSVFIILNRPGFTGDCLVLLKRLYRVCSCLHRRRPLPQLV